MPNVTAEQILHAHQWRYAVKKFDAARKIPAATWSALEQSLILSPSSFGLQPWKFIVITSAQLRQALLPQSWGQTQVTDCSHFVVFAARSSMGPDETSALIRRTSEVRGVPEANLAGYAQIINGFLANNETQGQTSAWTTRQAYIALANLMTSAALLEVDTCPMEGINPGAYDEILGLTNTGWKTVVACAVGYRSADDKYASAPKVRYTPETLVEHR